MPKPIDNESTLSTYFEKYVAAGKPGGLRFSAQHPWATLQALRSLTRLPQVAFDVPVSKGESRGESEGRGAGEDEDEGRMVFDAIAGRQVWSMLRPAVTILSIPEAPAEYLEGPSKQTLRRKIRAAEKAGVTWRPVDDQEQRAALLQRADAFERDSARDGYRNDQADNSHLLGLRLWLAAFGPDGEPLVLSAVPYAGEWAALSYFRTLSDSPAASDARYLMTKVLVDALSAAGVRHLADNVSPAHLSNGLRHFQRMVGYRIQNVRIPVSPTPTAEPTPAPLAS